MGSVKARDVVRGQGCPRCYRCCTEVRIQCKERSGYEIRRNEEKSERGVCRIQKRCASDNPSRGPGGNQQGYATVGCGSLVKLRIEECSRIKYAIITTKKVFQEGFDAQKYHVEFKKSHSKLKTFELDQAYTRPIFQDSASGLTVIPLNSHSSVFRHGFFKKKCRVLKHSPFEVQFVNGFSNGLCCRMVADDPSNNRLFGVKPHELTQDSPDQFSLQGSFRLSTRVPLGAAILRRVSNKWSLVGVLSSDSSNPETFPRPVWLSKEKFTNLRPGKFY